MRYTISEMASLLGVTTHTLRYYEKMGLIHPEVNEDTGYRYYTVTDTRRFNLCRELRAAELSLEECRELIGAPTVEQSDAMFNHHWPSVFWNTSGSSTVHWNRMPGASGCRISRKCGG